jgi:hypothetical protein
MMQTEDTRLRAPATRWVKIVVPYNFYPPVVPTPHTSADCEVAAQEHCSIRLNTQKGAMASIVDNKAMPIIDYAMSSAELQFGNEDSSIALDLSGKEYKHAYTTLLKLSRKYATGFRGKFTGGVVCYENRASADYLEIDLWRFMENEKPLGKARFYLNHSGEKFYLNYAGNPTKFALLPSMPEMQGQNVRAISCRSKRTSSVIISVFQALHAGILKDIGVAIFSAATIERISRGDLRIQKLDLAYWLFPKVNSAPKVRLFMDHVRAMYGSVRYSSGARLSLAELVGVRFKDLGSEGKGFSLVRLTTRKNNRPDEKFRVTFYDKESEVKETKSQPVAAEDVDTCGVRWDLRIDGKQLLSKSKQILSEMSGEFKVCSLDVLFPSDVSVTLDACRKLTELILEDLAWDFIATPMSVETVDSRVSLDETGVLKKWKDESADADYWLDKYSSVNSWWYGLIDARKSHIPRHVSRIKKQHGIDIRYPYCAYIALWLAFTDNMKSLADKLTLESFMYRLPAMNEKEFMQEFKHLKTIARNLQVSEREKLSFLKALSLENATYVEE